MASPFPGMDPYIEGRRLWVDFHNNLAGEIQAQLNAQIRPHYFAALTPYVTYETIEIARIERWAIRPDVAVLLRPPVSRYGGATAVLDMAPSENEIALDAPVELFSVEIRTSSEETLVTAIEILSPVNKQPGHDAHRDYLRKRRDILQSDAHLLEIDLLRAGARPPLRRQTSEAAYFVALSRSEKRPLVDVWPLRLRDRLPKLPVPLRAPDADAILDLSTAVRTVYERGAYDLRIDYSEQPPAPPLSLDDALWVEDLLAELRTA